MVFLAKYLRGKENFGVILSIMAPIVLNHGPPIRLRVFLKIEAKHPRSKPLFLIQTFRESWGLASGKRSIENNRQSEPYFGLDLTFAGSQGCTESHNMDNKTKGLSKANLIPAVGVNSSTHNPSSAF